MPGPPETLPHLLHRAPTRTMPANLSKMNLSELRPVARHWLDPERSRLPHDALVKAMIAAMNDPAVARRLFDRCSPAERAVLGSYARYGGMASGLVIDWDLRARGVLQVVEKKRSEHYTLRTWQTNPLEGLFRRCLLIRYQSADSYSYMPWDTNLGPDRPFGRYGVHPLILGLVDPAGPPGWTIPPAVGLPRSTTLRHPAEVALDLSRIFAWIEARGTVKARADRCLGAAGLKSLAKAVPLPEGGEFDLPTPHDFYFELLRQAGAIRIVGGEATPHPEGAARFFDQPSAMMARAWARGWLGAADWVSERRDEPDEYPTYEAGVATHRQILAWALGSLAQAGDRWYDLLTFVSALCQHAKGGPRSHFYGEGSWKLPLPGPEAKPGTDGERRLIGWMRHDGSLLASEIMVTLAAIGLVERGQFGGGKAVNWGFRLTDLGRAVFGAPEVPIPPEPAGTPFLVVQPNFDIVAYIDQAPARAVGILGRIAESVAGATGTVQTFRLTQNRVYAALEAGLTQQAILDYLALNGLRELPRNVAQLIADWGGKRESLVIRRGVNLLAFPSTAGRDAFATGRRNLQPLGDRFVIHTGRIDARTLPPGILRVEPGLDHRRTFTLSEHGELRTMGPPDLLQSARLGRIAERTPDGWSLTRDSIRRVASHGLRRSQIIAWLEEMATNGVPPLLGLAIESWMEPTRALRLGIGPAILLHIPEDEPFHILKESPLLRPYLRGSIGKHWLMARTDEAPALVELLESLGLLVLKDQVPLPDVKPPADEPGPEDRPTTKPRRTRKRS